VVRLVVGQVVRQVVGQVVVGQVVVGQVVWLGLGE
jgi:hypothetical protein